MPNWEEKQFRAIDQPLTFFFKKFIVGLGGGTLWHLQKFLQYIICIIVDFTLPSFAFILPSSFLE
jgi:hypothetical protein